MLFVLLYPFSVLYGWITGVRNFLFDLGLKRSSSFSPAVIGVGNLSVGGTGKSPMIEYLVNLLDGRFQLAILSRGYGRETRGYRLANDTDDAATLGDEPYQFYKKFKTTVTVVVCESRVEGITRLMREKPSVQVILLDDAFQHRAVRPLFSILLTDFSKPFFTDFLLPRGRLRESRWGSRRADAVIVTKCSDEPSLDESHWQRSIHFYSKAKPIFFSGIRYKKPVAMGDSSPAKNVVLVTGIANSATLVTYVKSHFNLVHHVHFDDHHHYSAADIENIQQKINSPDTFILTTEKDMVKLISPALKDVINTKLWFYLPIETYFLKSGSEFDKLIADKIEDHLTIHSSKS
ncbi:MAG: tetraacyldisaccharide 4'-kinase [Bacteroidetes bacterium]|nr:tetraacyldisaccharide 4'-kinase [Bacteroidota bacterium]